MNLIDPKLDSALSAFICGWDVLEKRIGGDDIIDMNLSDLVAPKEYQYRYDVLQDVEEFLKIGELKDHDIIRRKLISHRYFLLKTLGETIPFDEYLFQTMGIKPVLYSDKKIAAIKEEANICLVPLGLKVQPGIREDLNKLDKEVKEADLINFFDDFHAQVYAEALKVTDVQNDFKINYSQIDQDIARTAQIRGDGKVFNVEFNMFHMKTQKESEMKYLAAHEITAHAVQFNCVRHKIEAGLIPKYMSFVTTHEPVQFSAEGLAVSMCYFFPDLFGQTQVEKASIALDRLRRAVGNNASIMLNRGDSLQDCVDYIYENAPNYPPNRVAHVLSSLTTPIGSSYYQVYGQGLETFYQLSKTHADKSQFLKSVYEDFLMPEQIQSQLTKPLSESL